MLYRRCLGSSRCLLWCSRAYWITTTLVSKYSLFHLQCQETKTTKLDIISAFSWLINAFPICYQNSRQPNASDAFWILLNFGIFSTRILKWNFTFIIQIFQHKVQISFRWKIEWKQNQILMEEVPSYHLYQLRGFLKNTRTSTSWRAEAGWKNPLTIFSLPLGEASF